jgi:hypothetical protein
VSTAVRFQVEYPGRRDLLLVRAGRRPDLIPVALREAATQSSSGRIWLVLAEAGDRNPAWSQAMAHTGRVVRRQLPKLVVIDLDGRRR